MRTGARWFKLRKIPYQMEDIFMYLSLISFIITVALYYATIGTFFKVMAISEGRAQPYPDLPKDLLVMLKEFFVVQFFFWLTLWAVKWSLLFMFKRLTEGLPLYTQIWWGVLVYSILVFIGCCISNFTSCSSMQAWFTAGACNTARDARAKAISLWFSLAADLSTDLLIMAVPLRVLWNLRISRIEKISIGVVFAVGVITMVTAIIRSVSLNSSSSTGQVSTTWLMLWAGIEGAVAIIVGCLPSFAIFIRGRVVASKAQYEDNSNQSPQQYNSQPKSRDRTNSLGSQDPSPVWAAHDTCSDKSLVDGVIVTRKWTQKWHNPDRRQALQRDEEAGHELHPLPPS
ncbi:CFEM domain-containing protein [Cordyceps javanica]|uniref:CFEM domain-containing protein n=1 Tax=Cordyceps javanica TaxID=43265 RepID=A0A545W4R4_9HYPO|nr:CFEM domain-containing protein [Cordyceps javanica]TQW08989.1 CFEM domain-containing protein [Cordyceps javanica]